MDTSELLTDEYESHELRDLLCDYFLGADNNDGYRWFSRENIKIDYESRELTFHLDPTQANYGPSNFANRVDADTAFREQNLGFIPGFAFEQKMFDGTATTEEENRALEYDSPEIGGRMTITETSMYLDVGGELFIAVPLAIPSETYGLSGKLTGTSMHTGSGLINAGKRRKLIDPRNGRHEGNKLFDLQGKNRADKIIEKIDDFKLGEWTVKFEEPGGRYSKIDNVHIGRADDGAFEILSSHLFRSYEDVVSSYHIRENIGFDRPVSLVKVSDLFDCKDGEELIVQKLFYKNESISFGDLPDEYKEAIQEQKGNISIQNFTRTPPLRMFEGKLKTLLFTEEFKGILAGILQKTNATDLYRLGIQKEKEFAERVDLVGNDETFTYEIEIPENIEEMINNEQDLSDEERKNIIDYVSRKSLESDTEIELSPDFVLGTGDNQIFIEYKSSKGALTHDQSKEQSIRVALIQLFGKKTLNYNIVVGGDYGIDDTHTYAGNIRKVSETYLLPNTEKGTDGLIKFFS